MSDWNTRVADGVGKILLIMSEIALHFLSALEYGNYLKLYFLVIC